MKPRNTMSKAKGVKPKHVLPNADDVNPNRVCPRKKKENSMWTKSTINEEDPGCIKLLTGGIKSTSAESRIEGSNSTHEKDCSNNKKSKCKESRTNSVRPICVELKADKPEPS